MAQQFKVTLDSEKVVVLREMTIKLKNQTVEAAALRVPEKVSPAVFQSCLQDEMLKCMIVSIDGKNPSGGEREDLDALLSFSEYQDLMQAMADTMGKDPEKKVKPKVEIVIINS